MEVSFTARHGTVPESVRRHVEERLERLQKFEKRPLNAHIYFDAEGSEKRVEAQIKVAGGGSVVAVGAADNYRAAADVAMERAERQLKRERERYREHQAPKPMTP